MKRLQFTIALLLGLHFSIAATAQTQTIRLRVPNFARPLAERWIAEYTKTTKDVDFQFVSGKSADSENTISFVLAEASPAESAIYFGRYAVLPVTTAQSEAAELLKQKRLKAKQLKSLFFVKDELADDDQKESKAEKTLHIYTGNSQVSASRGYAAHFKQETTNFKGKKISGDDTFLNTAISRDPLGITINSLSNIYDLESRQLRNGLALLPLDVDKQSRQVLDEGNLDALIALLEQQPVGEIATGRIGVDYDHHNSQLTDFVRWILTDGKRLNHEFGLLQLSHKELTAQLRHVEQRDFAQKID